VSSAALAAIGPHKLVPLSTMRKVIALNAVIEALLGAGLPANHGTPEA
jgi:hypothetical protein